MYEYNEKFNKELENRKKSQSELKTRYLGEKKKKPSTLEHKKVDQRHERKVVEIIHTKHTQKI